MMKNLRINKELYRDGLRQLKIVGIMGMVIYCLSAILTSVGIYINSSYYRQAEMMDYPGNMGIVMEIAPEGLPIYEFHWILFTAFPILVPVMTLILFNFLNQRNASDFYHAIPDTRGTLYVSYCAAILTWLFAIIGVSSILAIAGISLIPGYFVVWSTLPKSLFIIIATCILVMGGILIAKSLTGTFMSNLAVTLMVLFLPRVFITAVMAIASDMLGFVVWDFSNSLMNGRYNVLVGIILTIFGGSNPLGYWSSGLYTLVLGLIYLAIAYVLFVRRKSESAGHAAISNRLQMVFRLAVSLAVCLFPIYFIAYNGTHSYGWSDSDLFMIVVFYVVAVVVYFIYELITTGKLRQFKRMLKGLILLAVGNVLVLGILWGIYGSVVNFQPSAEEIDYIRMLSNDRNYFQSQTDEIKISDEKVAEVTAEALKRTILRRTHTGETEVVVDETYYSKYAQEEAQVRTVHKEVAINCGLKTVYRELIYTEEEWALVAKCLSEMEEYRQVYCTLPKVSEEGRIYSYHGWISNEQAIKVYEVMKDEVHEVDFAEWYMGVTDFYSRDYLDAICVYTEIPGTGNYRTVNLPILDSMVRTKECYLEQMGVEQISEEEKTQWEMIRSSIRGVDPEAGSDKNTEETQVNYNNINVDIRVLDETWEIVDEVYFNLEGYHDGKSWVVNRWGHLSDEEQEEKLLSLIDKLYAGEFGRAETAGEMLMITVRCSYELDGGNYVDMTNNFCVSLTAEVETEIEELFGYQLDSYLGH
ncbi:MAG: hypothetical protein IJZ85_13040 [Lachnospiraceae bacterium]|nr:hypothetical protein [Lachnospiraceae bacterium]